MDDAEVVGLGPLRLRGSPQRVEKAADKGVSRRSGMIKTLWKRCDMHCTRPDHRDRSREEISAITRPLTASHARHLANMASDKAHVQYHGSWGAVGTTSSGSGWGGRPSVPGSATSACGAESLVSAGTRGQRIAVVMPRKATLAATAHLLPAVRLHSNTNQGASTIG
jgi:hypothetical protein